VSPSSGPTAGGTAVTFTGVNIDLDATLACDGNALSGVLVWDDTKATGTMPAGTAGTKNVTVTNVALGLNGTGTGAFTYISPARNRRLRLLKAFLEE
jgi:hypothetical protein